MKKIIISVDHVDETGKYWNESYIKNKTITVQDNESISDAIVEYITENDYCTFSYKGKPSIKDSIETLGVPHPEVDLILVNGKSIDFNYQLQDGDELHLPFP